MKKLSRCANGLATLLLLYASSNASAADLGFYVIVDGAANTVDVSPEGFAAGLTSFWQQVDAGPVVTGVGQDTKSKGYNFTVGYQLGTYFAIEGSYIVDFGKITYDHSVTFQSQGGPYDSHMSITTKGPMVSAVGLLPLGDYFSLDAHAGFFFIDNKYKINLSDPADGTVLQKFPVSESRTRLYYGAGVAWWITGQVALRLGYNRYTKAVFSEDVNEYTVGLRYSYGY